MRTRLGARFGFLAAAVVMALTPAAALAKGPRVCSGTFNSPGVVSGNYATGLIVKGVCGVDAGNARVSRTLTLSRGSFLEAAFGKNHRTGHGGSSLTVSGAVSVGRGATLVLGCNPTSFPCIDDPNQKNPTLSSPGRVTGGLTATAPLGVIVHTTTIGGSVKETGGGGGLSCAPPKSGAFADMMSPVYSDFEDDVVRGDLSITGLTSCWLGVARVDVGNLTLVNDQLGDPDAIEVLSNHISKNLACRGNRQMWDSAEISMNALFPRKPKPNTVHGRRTGQCVLASPTTQGGKPGPGKF